MKHTGKTAALITAAILLALCIIFPSCTKKGQTGDGEESTGSAETTESKEALEARKAAAKQKLEKAVTPTSEDATVITDGVLHISTNDSARHLIGKRGDLWYDVSVGSVDVSLLCRDENCRHSDITCTATPVTGSFGRWIVGSNVGDETVCYFAVDLRHAAARVDGFPTSMLGVELPDLVIYELNLETCERRCVAALETESDGSVRYAYRFSGYLDGIMYLSCTRTTLEAEEHEEYFAAALDVRTGELTLHEEIEGLTLCGMYGGKLCAKDGNKLVLYDTDLSSPEILAELDGYTLRDAVMSEDNIYVSAAKSGSDMCGIYRLSEDGALTLIAPDAVSTYSTGGSMYSYGGDLYFAKTDEREFGKYGTMTVRCEFGGTLYMYDAESGEIATVFEDCGGDPAAIYCIDGDSVIFFGCYYGGLAEGHKYTDTVNGNAYFRYDFKTGELNMIYEIGL